MEDIIFFVFIIKVNYTWNINKFIRFVFLFSNYPEIDTGLFWYINVLLVCMLVYPLIAGIKDEKMIIYLEILAFVTSIGTDILNSICTYAGLEDFNFSGLRNIMPLVNQPMLFFYLLGWIFNIKWKQIEDIMLKKELHYFPVFIMWVGVTGCMVLKYIQSGVWRWYGIYLENPYCRLPTIFIACGLFLFVYSLNNFTMYIKICLCKIGQNTLIIYYTHWLIAAWMKKYIFNDYESMFSFVFNIIRTIFIVLICYLVSVLHSYIISKIYKYFNNTEKN